MAPLDCAPCSLAFRWFAIWRRKVGNGYAKVLGVLVGRVMAGGAVIGVFRVSVAVADVGNPVTLAGFKLCAADGESGWLCSVPDGWIKAVPR